jgi:hypothetical protein
MPARATARRMALDFAAGLDPIALIVIMSSADDSSGDPADASSLVVNCSRNQSCGSRLAHVIVGERAR